MEDGSVHEPARYKQPVSVLVVIHTADLRVLLLERADFPGHWQSVTGSRNDDEPLDRTAAREVAEETGIIAAEHGGVIDWKTTNRFEIFARWRHRFAPGTTHNTEHVYSLPVAAEVPVRLAPREHLSYRWWPWQEAAARCFSWSNRDAILALPEWIAAATGRP
ncbi:MAG TPA: dihydroneopterin triphosphate diphosphatase [Casimicrobiaceae bacterium]|nr:dihydroneopterin triphosphate diphosphatase [Casimicrobiaceae bacterium]